MKVYRSIELTLSPDEIFDAEVPSERSNSRSMGGTHRMRVRWILLGDYMDGRPFEITFKGRRYHSRTGELGTITAWAKGVSLESITNQGVRFAVARLLRSAQQGVTL